MPGLFSRRRGSSAQRPPSESTLSAATAAASQAYIKTSQSAALSSAAAAAALRSATSSPEPVGSIQTQRMMRRASVSSVASGGIAGQGRPGVQRSNSSSSMTQRTFRTVSPSPSRANGARSPQSIAPPVPPMPTTLRGGPSKRSSSTEPVARVTSPTPMNGRRSASVDKPTTLPRTMRGSSRLADVPELATSGSQRGSVNFSRPRVGSPSPSPSPASPAQRRGWFSRPVGAVAETDTSSTRQAGNVNKPAVRKAAPTPIAPVAAQSQEMEYTMVFDPNSRTFVRKARPKPVEPTPPSPIVDNAPPLKPGDFNPATRSIVPKPKPVRTDSSNSITRGEPVPTAPETIPARNPARASTGQAASSANRSAGLLHKQPSVVREDADAERAAEASTPPSTSTRPSTSSRAPATPRATPSHQRSASLDVPHGPNHARVASLSPSRSTRFSNVPVVEGAIHEPHRGISPGKSAMKHSPSSSLRTASPVATFSPIIAAQNAPGDVSDTTSLTSADGAAAMKKKKSARVSFDDHAPTTAAPAKPTPVKTTRTIEIGSDDEDEVMQPRPALPNFGSVRRSKAEDDRAQVAKAHSPDRSQTTPETPAALPNVTDVKGSTAGSSTALPQTEPVPGIWEPIPGTAPEGNVPAINLSPPTPGLDEHDQREYTDDETPQMTESQELSNLASGVIFYGGESDDSRAKRLEEPIPAPMVRKDSDADEFSDAQESQDGNDGFASLDAIVESPIASPVKATAPTNEPLAAIPESTMVATKPNDGSGSPQSPSGDWTAATAYWSKLTQEKRAQQERDHFSSEDEAKPKRSFFNKKNKTTQPVAGTKASTADIRSKSPEPVHAAAVKQPLKPALKKTAQPAATPDSSVHMPRTMRGDGVAEAKARPQSAQIKGSDVPAIRARPASSNNFDSFRSTSSAGSASKAPRAPAPIAPASHTASKLSKKFQDDSDSESSFKKKRRPASTADGQGRFNMRRSMRAASVDSPSRIASPPPTGRTRPSSLLRSLSPSSITSGRDRGESLRQSLRGGPPDAGARTLRGTKPASQNRARPASSSMASKFKSRFVDSDDEDDAPRSAAKPAYRSRFVDSDDEDDMTIREELTPVRGIPRRKGQEDGDSTDLDDESDAGRKTGKNKNVNAIVTDPADVEKAMEAARRKLGIAEPGVTQTNGAPAQRTVQDRDNDKVLIPDMMSDAGSAAGKKKRGIMGSLFQRKRGSSLGQLSNAVPPLPPVASPQLHDTQAEAKNDSPASPSAAKLVRRTSQQPPRLLRENSGLSTATAPAAHGRHTLDEHWPLPPPLPADRLEIFKARDGERPQTSDEALESTRLAERPQNRRSFSARVGFTDEAIAHSERDESVAGSNAEAPVYSQRTGRKKRFGMLRRAFGLYD